MDNYNILLDTATLALKGKRYTEAESVYLQLATQHNSTEAWLGLGICKLYQLAEGRTMDEVVFCIERAKKISPEFSIDIENQLILNCQIVLNTYLSVLNKAFEKHKEMQNQAIGAAILTGAAVIAGSYSKSAFGTIASLGAASVGVGVAVDSFSKMKSLQEIQYFIIGKCDEINNSLLLTVEKSNPSLNSYLDYVTNIINNIKLYSPINKQTLPNSTTVLVLGILSLVFMCFYGLGAIFGIVGLVLSSEGRKMYESNTNKYDGFGNLNAGYIMSLIGTILNVLILVYVILYIIYLKPNGLIK
jgi:hypothetical protein